MKVLAALFSTLAGFFSLAQTVHLNSQFGNSGIVITPNTSEVNRIAIASNGLIFSAGYSIESGGTGIYHLTLAKNSIQGVPVSNFGTNGVVTTAIDYSEFPLDIQLQSDEKIVVSGSYYMGPGQNGPGDFQSFVVRYNTNGSLDNTFGNNGIFKLTHSDSHIAKMILLPDGSLLLAGNSYGQGTISKIDQNGVLVASFANGGSRFLSDGNFTFILWDAILLSDNTVLCVGYDMSDQNNMKVAACKIDLDGNFVPGFGTNGKVVTDLAPSGGTPVVSEYFQKVIELPNGQMVIGGQAMGAILAKMNPDGTFDSTFGSGGIVNHAYPFADFSVQPDGKFLVGGNQEVSTYNAGFSITRLNSNGTLDNSFNGTGTFTVDPSTDHDYLQTMELTGNGHIIVGGSSKLQNPNADFMLADIDISQTLNLQDNDWEAPAIYPNPFSDEITISFQDETITEITLEDAAGRSIATYRASGYTVLSLEHLDAGVYHLVFTNKRQQRFSRKLIKQ